MHAQHLVKVHVKHPVKAHAQPHAKAHAQLHAKVLATNVIHHVTFQIYLVLVLPNVVQAHQAKNNHALKKQNASLTLNITP